MAGSWFTQVRRFKSPVRTVAAVLLRSRETQANRDREQTAEKRQQRSPYSDGSTNNSSGTSRVSNRTLPMPGSERDSSTSRTVGDDNSRRRCPMTRDFPITNSVRR